LKYNEAVKPIMEDYKRIIGSQNKNLTIPIEVDQFFSFLSKKESDWGDRLLNFIEKNKELYAQTRFGNDEWNEGYKWEILKEANKVFQTPITKENIKEKTKELLSPSGKKHNLLRWSLVENTLEAVNKDPGAFSKAINILIDENKPLSKRNNQAKEIIDKIKGGVMGAPLTGYILSSFNNSKYPPYNDKLFTGLRESLNTDKEWGKIGKNPSAKYEIITQACLRIGKYLQEKGLLQDQEPVTALDGQDFLYVTLANTKKEHYWIYAPGRGADKWDEFKEKGIMAIGWDELGDLSNYKDEGEIRKAVKKAYPDGSDNPYNTVRACADFIEELKIGDTVFAKKGRNEIIGEGVVEGGFMYDKSRDSYKNTRKVKWIKSGSWTANKENTVTVKTLTKLDHKGYLEYLRDLMKESPCNYWIFQANPKIWKIEDALRDGMVETWAINQHKKDIKKGDKFIIYSTGSISSVCAAGEVLSDVRYMKEKNIEDVTKYDQPDLGDRANQLTDRVDIKVIHNWVENQIPKVEIQGNAKLKGIKIGSQGTNFSLTKEEYDEIIKLRSNQKAMIKNLNTIIYGPPGTGKTYALQKDYMPQFESSDFNEQDFLEEVIKPYSWWQVIAAAMIDLNKTVTVKEISSHKLIQAKLANSTTNSFTQTIWGQLQSHTIDECESVKYNKKTAPLIFNKKESGQWEILKDEVEEIVPEIIELLDQANNPKQDKERRYEFITFHQSYSYEEFIEGIKPVTDDDGQIRYEVQDGIFKKLSKKAEDNPDKDYAIFIDEINRGNISQILGELITLIEPDKRIGAENELRITLPYSNESFGVPKNLYIVATMNTADRSIALLDIALRRRFVFEGLYPNYEVPNIQYPELLRKLNKQIIQENGPDYQIGHSFMMKKSDTDFNLKEVMDNKIIPLLNEYFYNDIDTIKNILSKSGIKIDEEAREQEGRIMFKEYQQDNSATQDDQDNNDSQ